ncbi:ribonuclease [Rhizobacter sp. LjRoot28]
MLLATSALIGAGVDEASAKRPSPDAGTESSAVVRVDELPKQAVDTLLLIRQGGPFPYEKDGTVFGNRERLLPSHPRGYYREYTVKTVGARNRGARRIVCGGVRKTAPDACFYTADHYASFRRIAQ